MSEKYLIYIGFGLFITQVVGLYLSLWYTHKRSKNPNKRLCNANWQVSVHSGNLYEIKCRNCGVRVESGGTPICRN